MAGAKIVRVNSREPKAREDQSGPKAPPDGQEPGAKIDWISSRDPKAREDPAKTDPTQGTPGENQGARRPGAMCKK